MWDRCWSNARIHLGLTDEQFFSLTPRQFSLLMDRHKEREELKEFLSAQVVAAIVNHSFSPPEKEQAPADFMPSLIFERKRERKTRIDRKQVAADVRSLFAAYQPPKG